MPAQDSLAPSWATVPVFSDPTAVRNAGKSLARKLFRNFGRQIFLTILTRFTYFNFAGSVNMRVMVAGGPSGRAGSGGAAGSGGLLGGAGWVPAGGRAAFPPAGRARPRRCDNPTSAELQIRFHYLDGGAKCQFQSVLGSFPV